MDVWRWCRLGSSRQSSPSRSGSKCSRPPNRRRWRQQRLPALPNRPAHLRTKTKRTTCETRQQEVRFIWELSPGGLLFGMATLNVHSCGQRPLTRLAAWTWTMTLTTHLNLLRKLTTDGQIDSQTLVEPELKIWIERIVGFFCFFGNNLNFLSLILPSCFFG